MYETVSCTEKSADREPLILRDAFGFRRDGETGGEVPRQLVHNFVCTECGEVLDVVVAYDLVVRGRCGKTGRLVNVNVSRGYKLIQ